MAMEGKARRGGDGGLGAELWSAWCGGMTAAMGLSPTVHGGIGRVLRERAPESEGGAQTSALEGAEARGTRLGRWSAW
jgi:hypothetical protein